MSEDSDDSQQNEVEMQELNEEEIKLQTLLATFTETTDIMFNVNGSDTTMFRLTLGRSVSRTFKLETYREHNCTTAFFNADGVTIESYYFGVKYGHDCWVNHDLYFPIIFLLARIMYTPIVTLTDQSTKEFEVATKTGKEIVSLENNALSVKSHISFYRRQGFHNKVKEKEIVKIAKMFPREYLQGEVDPEKTYHALARNVFKRLTKEKDIPLTINDRRRIAKLNRIYDLLLQIDDDYIANATVDNNGFVARLNRVEKKHDTLYVYVNVLEVAPSAVILNRRERTKRAEGGKRKKIKYIRTTNKLLK